MRSAPNVTALVASLAVAVAATGAGCLGNSYNIPRQDLQRLAQTEPEERGQSVRIIQRFSTAEEPPEQAPAVRGNTTVVVVGVHGGGTGHRPAPRPRPRVPQAQAKSDKAYAYVVLAAIAAIGLAATEGARYDGWAELHPMHPVHLFGPHGEYTWMPLAHLDPQTAGWARRAVVRPSEGPMRRLGRAPLNRVGFNYSMLMGAGQLPSAHGDEELGFLAHIQFGYFPTQIVGLVFDIGLGWRNNQLGDQLFDSRYAGELQVMPLAAGKLHAGVFGQLGMGARFEDGVPAARRTSTIRGAGALLQLELTTRLTLTGRAGLTALHNETSTDFTVGVSVY